MPLMYYLSVKVGDSIDWRHVHPLVIEVVRMLDVDIACVET